MIAEPHLPPSRSAPQRFAAARLDDPERCSGTQPVERAGDGSPSLLRLTMTTICPAEVVEREEEVPVPEDAHEGALSRIPFTSRPRTRWWQWT
jgi:hypothetical protein